jgi:haloalkane dehalogenase
MTIVETAQAPAWLDRTAYPFAGQYLDVDGGLMHYLDEGQGRPVVMVHGTPTWSFLYRAQVGALRDEYRCVAADQIGFGLSAKPAGWSYTPAAHARNLASLIERLGLRDIVLVVHDFGGPIGLSYAVEHPENVAGLVVLNTWMWSLAGWNPSAERAMRLLGGPLGRFLYERLNLSPRLLLPQLFGDRKKLTPELHRQYLAPFATAQERHSTWALARELLASGAWYEGLWARRAALADKPALLIWGMADAAFDERALARWEQALPKARVRRLDGVGHFVQEEAGAELTAQLRTFLAELPANKRN